MPMPGGWNQAPAVARALTWRAVLAGQWSRRAGYSHPLRLKYSQGSTAEMTISPSANG
jgi:hypothetical protein